METIARIGTLIVYALMLMLAIYRFNKKETLEAIYFLIWGLILAVFLNN